ncbi:MAG: multidrug resistance protein [Gammaproteobacteria bacterium]|jgi:DHA2 family multidrug resistance protein|nr:multidrug resistance protein [Gammaproteobacteria bacterium]
MTTKPLDQWVILFTMMLLAIIEVLDSTIVSVALPSMMGHLGTSYSEISWVVTTYVIASAIAMPLTGAFVRKLGETKVVILSSAGFLLGSIGCGFSSSLIEICLFRVVQGFFGATLVPLAQSIISEVFPKSQNEKVMAIWGIGVMVAPILGPVVGGWIVQHFGWPLIFFINVPICVTTIILAKIFVPSKNYPQERFDWTGFGLLAIGIGSLQFFFDKGHDLGWFQSEALSIAFIVCIFFIFLLIYHCIQKKDNPVLNLALFRRPNFSLGCSLIFLYCIAILSINTLQQILLQSIYGVTPELGGQLMLPSGIACGVIMGLSSKLMRWVSPKILIAVGIVFLFLGTWLFQNLSPTTDLGFVVMLDVTRGIGLGFSFVPLTVIVFNFLQGEENMAGAGLFNLSRNLGSSIGVSLATTLLACFSQNYWHHLISFLTPTSSGVKLWLAQQKILPHATAYSPIVRGIWAGEVTKQAFVLSFGLTSVMVSLVYVFVFILMLIMRTPKSLDVQSGV